MYRFNLQHYSTQTAITVDYIGKSKLSRFVCHMLLYRCKHQLNTVFEVALNGRYYLWASNGCDS